MRYLIFVVSMFLLCGCVPGAYVMAHLEGIAATGTVLGVAAAATGVVSGIEQDVVGWAAAKKALTSLPSMPGSSTVVAP